MDGLCSLIPVEIDVFSYRVLLKRQGICQGVDGPGDRYCGQVPVSQSSEENPLAFTFNVVH